MKFNSDICACVRARVSSCSFQMKSLILGIGQEILLQLLFVFGLSSEVQLKDHGLWPPNVHSNLTLPILSG